MPGPGPLIPESLLPLDSQPVNLLSCQIWTPSSCSAAPEALSPKSSRPLNSNAYLSNSNTLAPDTQMIHRYVLSLLPYTAAPGLSSPASLYA